MNILIPLAGDNYTKDGKLIPLIEINKKTVIEYVLDNLNFNSSGKFIFVLKESDCKEHHIDSAIRLLKPNSEIIIVKSETQGQLCSCLLATGYIDNEKPLLIVNGDQYIFDDARRILENFQNKKADGGIVTFTSIHPKWSYALLDKDNETVIETSEKVPISKDACAGMFYYRRGKDFVEAAKAVIRKDTSINGKYYVSSTYNEIILSNKKILAYRLNNENFFALDSEKTITNFMLRLAK